MRDEGNTSRSVLQYPRTPTSSRRTHKSALTVGLKVLVQSPCCSPKHASVLLIFFATGSANTHRKIYLPKHSDREYPSILSQGKQQSRVRVCHEPMNSSLRYQFHLVTSCLQAYLKPWQFFSL